MVGNQPRRTAKMYLRMIARKKTGIEIPISEANRDKWSNHDPYRFAARNPSGIPKQPAKIIAATASSTVAGKRSEISEVTVRRSELLTPRSPERVVFTYAQYCT